MTRAEKEQLVCHYGRMNRLELYTGAKTISPAASKNVERALKKRERGIPLQHITGRAPFYGRDFIVTPDVLIPRPETERLLEEALRILETRYKGKTPRILDLGTGSGCLAASLTLEWPACRMTALDVSKKALRVARNNFKLLGLGKKIISVQSRLFGHFEKKRALWDVIVSNPPYIPGPDLKRLSREVRREPRLALDGGADGLDVVRALLAEAPRYLKPGGYLLVEIGQGQSKTLAKELARRRTYASVAFEKDLNGIERILIARIHG